MDDVDLRVEGLKRVGLSFEVGTAENRMDVTPGPVLFELVVGIGTDGFTPFEYALLGKKAGDTVRLEVQTSRIRDMFGHIDMPLPPSARGLDIFFLNVTVDHIDEMDQTALVRAMAGAVGDCGGDCCGHH
ncbi:MAG: hypothetical protein JRL30_18955 [Deltaproteobacteria bacterium]|jgi:hypothetical protein|nr:hypothetical protein [Deltaproteobacteria bacterium]